MPTGYTDTLYKGKPQTFVEFTLEAARAMGAGIMQRDDAPGPISGEYEGSSYYRDSLAHDGAKLTEYRARNADQWRAAEEKARNEQTKHTSEAIEQAAALRVRYERMLAEVQAWVPPTSEHQGLKDFMVQQLTDSIKFDCSTTYLNIPPVRPWEEFKVAEIANAEKSLERSRRGFIEEEERVASRNKWVRDLRESLGAAVVGAIPGGQKDA